MERLSFTSKFAYNATEAAIHMARYQIAAPFCRDARVLDVACGEGYGALALKRFGAATVEAVDSSADAINTARKLFRTAGVNHQVGDASRVDEMFRSAEFDVVVSLETIEHLPDPERFLRALMRVAKTDAVIIISCPNDHWYYPTPEQSNPFHVRKYSFEEFRVLTTKVLGNNVAWGYGVPMVGFGNVTDDELAGRDQLLGQAMMLDFTPQSSAITLPQRQFSDVGPRTCSYFIGVWGAPSTAIHSAAVVPISMNQFANLVSWETAGKSPQQLVTLEAEKAELSSSLSSLQAQLGEATAALSRQRDEREALARDLAQLQEQRATLEVRLARTSAEAAHENAKAIALTLELERERAGHARIRTEFASLDETASQAQARAQSLSQLLESERSAHASARFDLGGTQSRIDALEARHGELQAAGMVLQAERDELHAAHGTLQATCALLQEELGVRQSAGVALQAERDELQAAHRALEATCASLREELAVRQAEVTDYRIRALALAKELDIATSHAQALTIRLGEQEQRAAAVDWEAAMAQLRAQASASHAEADRFRNRVSELDNEVSGLRQSMSALDEQVAAQTRRADGYRVQIVALSKELDIAAGQVQALSRDLAKSQSDSASSATAAAAAQDAAALATARFASLAPPPAPDIDAIRREVRAELEPEMEGLRGEAERHRVQAIALTKEFDVLTQRVGELSNGVVTGGIKAAVIRSGKYRIRRAAARVKPILPGRVLALAQRAARRFNI